MDGDFRRWLFGAALTVTMSLGGWSYSIYKSTVTRFENSEHAVTAMDKRLGIVEERTEKTDHSIDRLEDKIDWLIRTENEQHRLHTPQP